MLNPLCSKVWKPISDVARGFLGNKTFIDSHGLINLLKSNQLATTPSLCTCPAVYSINNQNGLTMNQRRQMSAYPPDIEIETPSPYKGKEIQHRYKYNWEFYTGGVLPRPKDLEDTPVKGMPDWYKWQKDTWTPKKAMFGRNDYIDILGDGTVHPRDLLTGPAWAKGENVNEYKRIVRQFEFEAEYLRQRRPAKYHSLSKQLFFLYKKLNRRKRASHWGKSAPMRKSKTDQYNRSKTWKY